MCLTQTEAYMGFGPMLHSRVSANPGLLLSCMGAMAALLARDAKLRRHSWDNWGVRDLHIPCAERQSLGQTLGPLTRRCKAVQGNRSSSGHGASLPRAQLE